ncbi:MAG: protein kinase [Clostridia bacterium]|nr:protein kinase [Clostridia bacterium]
MLPVSDLPSLPVSVSGKYRLLSCLKDSECVSICLGEHIETGEKVIIKLADNSDMAKNLKTEYTYLKRIEADGCNTARLFPRCLQFFTADTGQVCLIREYINGCSLESFVERRIEKPGIGRMETLNCAAQLLQQLKLLHDLRPPVIHRDVKPQNVILDDTGAYRLIDLGIAREHKKGEDADTEIVGTSLTAPPEQFGFRATDQRSDLYSLGVLMRFCMTGEYGDDADSEIDADLRRVIKRATRFDPDERYKSADTMLRDIEALRGSRTPICALTAVVLLLALAAFSLLIRTLLVNGGNTAYVFREPLFEQAVRQQLGKYSGEITTDELKKVRAIHIFGCQVYDSEEQIWFLGDQAYMREASLRDAGLWRQRGSIESLEDARHMPNLSELYIYNQPLNDISSLEKMNLTALGIGYCDVHGLSALGDMTELTYLNLSGLTGIDTLQLQQLGKLETLCLAGAEINSLKPLTYLKELKSLNLYGVNADYTPISAMKSLKEITINRPDESIFRILASLKLESLSVVHSGNVPFELYERIETLETLYYYSDQNETLPDRPLRFANMKWLDIKNAAIPSLDCFAKMKKLQTLLIYASAVSNYNGIETLPALNEVHCTPEQAAMLDEIYHDHTWRMVIIQ